MQKTVLVALVCAGLCKADSIQPLATCSVGGQVVQDPASCSLSVPSANLWAVADVQYNSGLANTGILGGPGYSFSVGVDGGAEIQYLGLPEPTGPGTATSRLTFVETLTTAGPARAGWLSMFYVTNYLAALDFQATVGQNSLTPQNTLGPPTVVVVPIQLGSPFVVTLIGQAGISYGTIPNPIYYTGEVSFQLNEVTAGGGIGAPVQLFLTPEPGTWAVSLLSLLLFSVCARPRHPAHPRLPRLN